MAFTPAEKQRRANDVLHRPGGVRISQALDLAAGNALAAVVDQHTVSPLGNAYIQLDPSWFAANRVLWQQNYANAMFSSVQPNAQSDVPRVWFTFLDFESGIPETQAPNYADVDIIGRNGAHKVYINSGNREVSFPIQFMAQGVTSGTLEDIADNEVVAPVKFLQTLTRPLIDVASGLTYAPPPVILHVGGIINNMRGVLTEASVTWKGPVTPGLKPMAAEVNLTVAETDPYGDKGR